MYLQPGDAILCKFPYREDHAKYTVRPGLLTRVVQPGILFKVAQITSTDRSGELPGLMIKASSKEGRAMRLRNDSFINLANILPLQSYMIERLIGICPSMNQVERICAERRIHY